MQQHEHLVIIGNGIAGVTLAQQVRKRSNVRITLISAESATHFSRPALMYVYMGHMRYKDIVPYPDWYWRKNNITLVHDRVVSIDFEQKQLHLQKGEPITFHTLVLATGSTTAYYNWPGQHLKGVQGLVTLQDLEQMETQTKGINEAVIVGGGLIGIEMAEMLKSRGIAVTMLVRDKLYWQNVLPGQEATLITQHIQNQGINLKLTTELDEILGDTAGQVGAVKTNTGETIPCQFVGIATGVKPNTDFLRNTALQLNKGILIDNQFKTNIPGVYAIGDCAEFREKYEQQPALEQLWYTARLHGEALAAILCGKAQNYERGPWFNSAKFLNIEYQTYGYVPNSWDETKYDSLYWQNTAGTKAIRLFYERDTEMLKGINLLGIRYRHDLCHHWLKQKYKLQDVIYELEAANFDPEFYRHYEPELRQLYFNKFPDKAQQKKQNSWWQLRKKFGLAMHLENSDKPL
ncbi:NAD(P)/FAD-dependent oxidoreductase [Pontibacter vulgaris]|uniref:NAD(P)/FAD-dependent oxidoreductase n=1 Tax=Pontibacter vulgaris TaxID=2905679 RepID=UPI001FA6B422|nr:FAD-dependent oxidoreductase [Pontibacter vulgaris]